MDHKWTEEQRARAIELWNRGYTATQIALEPEFTGLTRNSVVGQIWRLRVEYPDRITRRVRKPPGEAPYLRRYSRIRTKKLIGIATNPDSKGVPLQKLKWNGCHFIVSSDYSRSPTHLYCGVVCANGYCPHHAKQMHH